MSCTGIFCLLHQVDYLLRCKAKIENFKQPNLDQIETIQTPLKRHQIKRKEIDQQVNKSRSFQFKEIWLDVNQIITSSEDVKTLKSTSIKHAKWYKEHRPTLEGANVRTAAQKSFLSFTH